MEDIDHPTPTAPETAHEPELPPDPQPTVLDFLRHGQVVTPNLFCAPSQEPLSMSGWKQLTLATQNGQWDVVISSPSRRCHDFAKLLAQRLRCPFEVHQHLCEMDFGDWIGKTQQQIWEESPDMLQRLWQQPLRFHAPRGESMDQFINRVHYAWDDIQTRYAGKHILIMSHAGVIRVLLARVLNIPYQRSLRFEIDYAQITRFKVYPDGTPSIAAHGLPQVP